MKIATKICIICVAAQKGDVYVYERKDKNNRKEKEKIYC